MRRLQKTATQLHEEPTPSSLPPPPSSRPPRPLTLSLSSWPPVRTSPSSNTQSSSSVCLFPGQELGGEVVDEEIALDDALATDLSIIAPVSLCSLFSREFMIDVAAVQATTPDPGGVQSKQIFTTSCLTAIPSPPLFPALLPDLAGQEPEGFVLLTPDLPPRKRSLSSSLDHLMCRHYLRRLRTGGSFTE